MPYRGGPLLVLNGDGGDVTGRNTLAGYVVHHDEDGNLRSGPRGLGDTHVDLPDPRKLWRESGERDGVDASFLGAARIAHVAGVDPDLGHDRGRYQPGSRNVSVRRSALHKALPSGVDRNIRTGGRRVGGAVDCPVRIVDH